MFFIPALHFKVVPAKVIENVLQICYRGHFEKLEVAVKVRIIVKLCSLFTSLVWSKPFITVGLLFDY